MNEEAKMKSPHRPVQDTEKPHHEHLRIKFIAIGLIILLSITFGFAGGWLGASSQNQQRKFSETAEHGRRLSENQSTLISELVEEVGPSVVSIEVIGNRTEINPFFGPQTERVRSAGTGFIISDNGYVLTNRHVIPSGTTKVRLTLSNGTVLDDVSVVGRTSSSDPLDIAFLKINNTKGKTLKPVKIGDSQALKVGDQVIAIGNALGQFQNTVTSGIVSGFNRDVQASGGDDEGSLQNLIQTDAAINQGNSGGPLINVNGEVVGVNTAVAAGDAQGIGFAIPINDVKGLINSVLESGKVKRPYLGVRYIQLDPGIAKELNIKHQQGSYVPKDGNQPSVIPDSPAAVAGIKPGDIIIKVNNTEVTTNNPLSSVIAQYKVGEQVRITLIRNSKELTLTVTLAQMPAQD